MTHKALIGGEEFESGCDVLDVTRLSRVDPSWVKVDATGHEHRWYLNGQPATGYDPAAIYETPTLVEIHDGYGYFEDGERYSLNHLECRICGETVQPGFRSDDSKQYIAGLRWWRIDGVNVSREEFEARLLEAMNKG